MSHVLTEACDMSALGSPPVMGRVGRDGEVVRVTIGGKEGWGGHPQTSQELISCRPEQREA